MKTPTAKKKQKAARAKYVCTFVYLDEPQLILLERGKDARVIAVAINKGGMEFPFLGAEISLSQLERYQHEFVDLRYLFQMPYYDKWYIFDLAALQSDKTITLTLAQSSDYENDEYLPAHQFFASSHTEPEENRPILAERETQTHLLAGNWEPNDLSKFFSRVSDLYSFYFSLRKLKTKRGVPDVQKVNLRKAFTEYPFRGGSSYVNFYRDLASALGFHERLAMAGIQKRSPGYVDIAGHSSALGDTVDALKHFAGNYEKLNEQYKFFHDLLSKLDFLKHAPDQLHIGEATSESIATHSRELAKGLGLHYDEIDALTGNPLSTAKIVLSHYRRINRYFLFFAEGRLHFPDDDSSDYVANSPSIGDS
jgi:hypothetical protein